MQSIVGWLVEFATDVVAAWGIPGVFVLMTLESACIPVPSEAIMLFAGFAVSEGDMSFWAAVAAGVAGNVVGSWIAYWIGLYGGRPWARLMPWPPARALVVRRVLSGVCRPSSTTSSCG